MRTFLTASVLAVVALVATNPTTDEYVSWAVQKEQTGQEGAGDLLMRFVGAPLIKASTTSSNFTLFSTFVTSVDRDTKIVAIGALHRFVAFPMRDAWRPGSRYAASPHVIATDQVDRWAPEDGYTWVAIPPAGNVQVKWTPGISSKSWPHVVAGATEGRWYPEDGYSWIEMPSVPGNLRVKWTPGSASRQHEHIVAASQEQRWLPKQGFEWIENPPNPGDFRVRLVALPPGDFRATPQSKAWDPEHATPQDFEKHARAMEASLPSCSKEFEDRWSHWHSEGWYSRQMPKTAACIMHGETGHYKCDGSGCCRIGSAC